jgi:hypothetical protein
MFDSNYRFSQIKLHDLYSYKKKYTQDILRIL